MILKFKVFETWNDNNIDDSLFISNRAKHNPKVFRNTIKYRTDNGKYTAKIEQIDSDSFICKIYLSKGGEKIRVKKKTKNNLKSAHDFVRNYLSKKTKNSNKTSKKNIDKPDIYKQKNDFKPEFFPEFYPTNSKTKIRRFN